MARSASPTRTLACQLLVAMLASVAIGELFVAIPYFSRDQLHAKGAAIGWMGGIYQGAYAIVVYAFRKQLDRFDLRHLTLLGCGLSALILAAMPFSGSVGGLMACMALFGVVTMLLWPPLMGWISRGVEGATLNRRLGWYNAAWSLGLILGPLLGGWLYGIGHLLPFLVAGGVFGLCVLSLWAADPAPPLRRAAPLIDLDPPADAGAVHADDSVAALGRIAAFRRMARVGLVTTYMAIGLLRYQLPPVAQQMGVDSLHYGPISMTLSASLSLGFLILGVFPGWHFQLWPVWLCQAAMATGLFAVYWGSGIASLLVASALCGFGTSLLYAAHLFYGVSGGHDRARLMAVHELLLSGGFVLGAIGGGVLADQFGLLTPYLLFGLILSAGLLLVIAMTPQARRRPVTGS